MFLDDPFANDPFFQDRGGFGSMDNMISEMRHEMKQGMNGSGIRGQMEKMGSGKFA